MTFKGKARHEFLCLDILFLLNSHIACMLFFSLSSSHWTYFRLKSNPDAPRHGRRRQQEKKHHKIASKSFADSLNFFFCYLQSRTPDLHIPPAMVKQDSYNSFPSMRAIQRFFKNKINHKSFNFFWAREKRRKIYNMTVKKAWKKIFSVLFNLTQEHLITLLCYEIHTCTWNLRRFWEWIESERIEREREFLREWLK